MTTKSASEVLLGRDGAAAAAFRSAKRSRDNNLPPPPTVAKKANTVVPEPSGDQDDDFAAFLADVETVEKAAPAALAVSTFASEEEVAVESGEADIGEVNYEQGEDVEQAAYEARVGRMHMLAGTGDNGAIGADAAEILAATENEEGEKEIDLVAIMKEKKRQEKAERKRLKAARKAEDGIDESWRNGH